MNSKPIIVGFLLITIGSFFLGFDISHAMEHKQVITTNCGIPPKWIEIPSNSWVTIGDRYFSYKWNGHMYSYGSPVIGANDSRTTGGYLYDTGMVSYCGPDVTWDGYFAYVGLTIHVGGWGTYKITDMNEGYVCLTLEK